MNYYKARQRKDGRWDYTCMNDGQIWPLGYCDEWRPINERIANYFSAEDKEKHDSFKDKHHCGGHETPEEAYACYKEYVLDQSLHTHEFEPWSACLECGKRTPYAVAEKGSISDMALCEAHQSREVIAKHLNIGERWSSS